MMHRVILVGLTIAAFAAASASPQSPAQAATTPRETDSTHSRLIPGRKKHDSVSFASTVAFGRHQMTNWPTPPAPLPGSIFPDNRIVAFYGNPLSKRMGVFGEYPAESDAHEARRRGARVAACRSIDTGAAGAATDRRRRPRRSRQGRHVSPAHGLGAHREGVRLGEAEERAALSRHSGRARARCSASCLGSCHFSHVPTSISRWMRNSRCTTARRGWRRERRSGSSTPPDINWVSEQLAPARDGEEAAAQDPRRAPVDASR